MRVWFAALAALAMMHMPSLARADDPAAPAAPPPQATADADAAMHAAFNESYLRYDDATGRVRQGASGREVPWLELYGLIDRPDLIDEVKARSSKRTWLYIGGAALAVTGSAIGIALVATEPDETGPECLTEPKRFTTSCDADIARRHAFAVVAIATGVLGGTGLAYWGATVNLQPLGPNELERAIAGHNARLTQRLTDSRPKSGPTSLRIVPRVDLHGGGLTAVGTF